MDYQRNVLFVAQDIDFVTGCMCYIQLSLLGCAGYVVVGDTIVNPSTALDERGLIPVDGENVWYTPMYFEDTWHLRRQWFLAGDFIRRTAAQAVSCPIQADTAETEVLQVNDTGQMMLF